MGNYFRRTNFLILDRISEEYSYLQAKGKITCHPDLQFDVLNLKIDIDSNYSQEISIWPNDNNSNRWNIFRTTIIFIIF